MITLTEHELKVASEAFARKPAATMFPQAPGYMAEGICVTCGGSATTFRDYLSVKEWYISGICQDCQDDTYGEDEDAD